MKSIIIHADGRRTDLSAAVDPDAYAELGNRALLAHQPFAVVRLMRRQLYIRHGSTRTDELFGAHHHATDCTADLTDPQVPDE